MISERAPIYLNFALQIHLNHELAMERLGEAHWNSNMGRRVREWLMTEGMAEIEVEFVWGPDDPGSDKRLLMEKNEFYKLTDKGRAWVGHACDTPLPVASWSRGKEL